MPHQVTKSLEAKISEYTGAPYVVAVNSCTMALLLSCAYAYHQSGSRAVSIPKRTYCSLPQLVKQSGHSVIFRDYTWIGGYQLMPLYVWDYARRFTSNMYSKGQYQCVSFHSSKILGDTQGGAILHDNAEADKWLRKARFDGRTEGVAPIDENFDMLGYHCYLSPDVAARLLLKLAVLPKKNQDLPNDLYPDLSTFEVFQ